MIKKGQVTMLDKFALPGPGSKYQAPEGQPAGFWAGVWHGSIAPISFLVSLWQDSVGVYETHNVGKWYNFGFILGAAMAFGGKRVVVVKKGHESCEDDEEETEEE
jgi:hypothetical protein